MENSEFIETYNNIFAYKIKPNDLAKPNELFVFNVLINYLQKFNIDIAPMLNKFNSESYEDRLNFKIKFCKAIDYLYKISDKTHSFLYNDLIHPSPKKTAHMLKILLNYYLFYAQTKEEIMCLAEMSIDEKNRICQQFNQLKIDNEELKIKRETIEKGIQEHQKTLNELNESLDSLQYKERSLMEEKQKVNGTLESCRNNLHQLKEKEIFLKNQIVSDKEVDALMKNKETLTKLIEEQEEIARSTMSSNQTRSQMINELQPLVSRINEFKEKYTAERVLWIVKEVKSKCQQANSTQKQLIDKTAALDDEIEETSKEVGTLEVELGEKNSNLKAILESAERHKTEQKSRLSATKTLNRELLQERDRVDEEFKAEDENGDFLLDSAVQLVDYYKNVVRFE